MDLDLILNGEEQVPLSHGGGELAAMIEANMRAERDLKKDNRDRCDRTEKRNNSFKEQLEEMVNSYLDWSMRSGEMAYADPSASEAANTRSENQWVVTVIDVFPNQGTFSYGNFVKTLCNIHLTPYKPHMRKHLTIAYDVYLSICERVSLRVQQMLRRDSVHWRLKHACPSCTYILEKEPELKFKMLFTMDGNDSLKRVLRDPLYDYAEAPDGDVVMTRTSIELPDQRQVGGDYYIPCDRVAKWTKNCNVQSNSSGDPDSESPCAGQWKNMSDASTAKSWSIFDENGVFIAVCRHGFVLTVADMVCSGEGSQYPLAVVETLLDTFGTNLGGGYDIGCRFKITIAKSDLGQRAKELSYSSLIGSFHGHAHNRLCQLSHLATYVKGLGLSDLENCERLFARSNDLASSVRHASVFHRQQRIVGYYQHLDVTDTYEGLSDMLVNNYSKALKILAAESSIGPRMAKLGIRGAETFAEWLVEERSYLESLLREPPHETAEMKYFKCLESLIAVERMLGVNKTFCIETNEHGLPVHSPANVATEAERRRLMMQSIKLAQLSHEYERKLGIEKPWQEGDENWRRVSDMVVQQQYRRRLDRLEQLVVSRMFELGRINRSGTGNHIGKALQSRSQAIRTALQQFNTAAKKLKPPRETLKWETVVDYAFLSEFNILADTRQDVRAKTWTRPAVRTLMDEYFKMERAREEIARLNIEIPRLVTYIRDEEGFLASMEQHLKPDHPEISHQISLRRRRFKQTKRSHLERLQSLLDKGGFTGSLSAGMAIEHIVGSLQPLVQVVNVVGNQRGPSTLLDPQLAEAEKEAEEDEREEELIEDLEVVMQVLDLDLEDETSTDHLLAETTALD
ncbi:hypothetical protein NP233_g2769 [Leucocoprinus birnbaumii]|uniref:Uncharacterized protein n=1 Tax=Leucocoprinus birnbaumii TaxID=56174 RepID=A0AAD5YTE3_9AGAR|nr:hypothetical protein NP233_g2769 [Leucocoprinus birnbaumii]